MYSTVESFFSLKTPVLILDSIEGFNTATSIGAALSQELIPTDILRHVTITDHPCVLILISASDLIGRKLYLTGLAKETRPIT
jgi:hypothetical protein